MEKRYTQKSVNTMIATAELIFFK